MQLATRSRTIWNRTVAVTAAAAVAAAIAVPPATANAVSARPSLTERSYALSASESVGPVTLALPASVDQLVAAIIPSFGSPVPTPPATGPVVVPTNVNSAIKNIYNTVEPWVRYGFELATYAVGWVPYVGWLSGQIMIFYNFGERIARSVTFNVDDWLFGPLPFVQGLRNVAQDSWNALVQLGIDQWNFWLPPLPPLPLTATKAAVAEDTTSMRVLGTTQDIEAAATTQQAPEAAASADEQTPPAESSDDMSNAVEDKTDVVGDKTDVVDDKTDVVDAKTDVVDAKTDVVENKTDVVDNKTDDTTDAVDNADAVSAEHADGSSAQKPDPTPDRHGSPEHESSSDAGTTVSDHAANASLSRVGAPEASAQGPTT